MIQKKILVYQKEFGIGDFFLALPIMLSLQELYPKSCFHIPDLLYNFFKNSMIFNHCALLSSLNVEQDKNNYAYVLDLSNFIVRNKETGDDVKQLNFSTFHNKSQMHASEHYFHAINKIEPKVTLELFQKYLKMPIVELAVEENFYHTRNISPFKYFTVHTGAGFKYKNWPAEYFEQLIELILINYPDIHCCILEGPKDPEIFKNMKIPSRVIVLKETFEDVSKVLNGSLFHIDNDSGIHHLAGVMDIPAITIFGPTGPGTWKSLSNKNNVFWGWNNCNTVCDLQTILSCQDKVCLNSITPDQVFNIIPDLLCDLVYQST